MKAKYSFKVEGRVRPSADLLVPCRGWEFSWKKRNGLITHIVVVIPHLHKENWPTSTQNPEPGIAALVEPKAPHLPFIQRELRALQGLLGLFGLKSIDSDRPEIEWIPDSDEEKEALQIYSYKSEANPLPDEHIRPLSVDLIARSILAADAATDIDVPLNFFRRGVSAIEQRDYISAIYEFYFVVETLYANGQFRKNAVLSEYRKSAELKQCVKRTLDFAESFLGQERKKIARVEQAYGSLSVDDVLERLVELRGRLHHHTPKRRGTWHPEDRRRFEVDASFFEALAYNICFKQSEKYLWSEDVIGEYEKIARSHNDRVLNERS